MPLRSRIVYDLPPEHRTELEQRIIRDGYSRYGAHAAWLADLGYPISESSVQRYGRQLQQTERIRTATREAQALRESTPDDGELADSTIRLVQAAIYEFISRHGDDPSALATVRADIRALAAAGHAVADLSRASRAVRDERRLTAREAADQAAQAARQAGVSPAVEAAIRAALEPGDTPRQNPH